MCYLVSMEGYTPYVTPQTLFYETLGADVMWVHDEYSGPRPWMWAWDALAPRSPDIIMCKHGTFRPYRSE